jgi:tRNA threonylcarbamoyladenosine biosynthesis protein TsaE
VRRQEVALPTAEDTRAWGERLGAVLRAGDLVVLTGDLGAGKTTLTQGIAEGLGVRGPVTSPTFVIARVHPSLVGGPALVHVDAYRLGGLAELDDLDLDTSLEDSVTIVEWGHGLAEGLSEDRLEITLRGDDERLATISAWGPRWDGERAQAELGTLAEVP